MRLFLFREAVTYTSHTLCLASAENRPRMAYSFAAKTSPASNLKKVARSQVKKARIETAMADTQEATHQVRKRCKKMRALMRLIRNNSTYTEQLYRSENARYRRIGQLLSEHRDAVSLYEAVRKQLGANDFPQISAFLEARIEGDDIAQLREAAELLRRGKQQIQKWEIEDLTWRDLERGYKKRYRKATKALQKAMEMESDENFHELRKRVKDHWYHSRLLKKRYPKKIGRRCKPLKALASDLGDWRDLRLLCHFLALNSARLGGDAGAELIPLLDKAQQRLLELRKKIDRQTRTLFPHKHRIKLK